LTLSGSDTPLLIGQQAEVSARVFLRFRACKHKAKKSAGARRKNERERKKCEFALFVPVPRNTGSPVPGPIATRQSYPGSTLPAVFHWNPVPAILAYCICSGCLVLAVLLCPALTILPWQPCLDSPVLQVLFCLSYSACPALAVTFWLSRSGCPFLAVLF
jgi:hypothetical protein